MQARVVLFRSMPIGVGLLQQTYPFLQPADLLKSKNRLAISTLTLGVVAVAACTESPTAPQSMSPPDVARQPLASGTLGSRGSSRFTCIVSQLDPSGRQKFRYSRIRLKTPPGLSSGDVTKIYKIVFRTSGAARGADPVGAANCRIPNTDAAIFFMRHYANGLGATAWISAPAPASIDLGSSTVFIDDKRGIRPTLDVAIWLRGVTVTGTPPWTRSGASGSLTGGCGDDPGCGSIFDSGGGAGWDPGAPYDPSPEDAPDGVSQDAFDLFNPAEKALCKANPIDCLTYVSAANSALGWANGRAAQLGLPNASDNLADAERHAFWSALLSKQFSYTHGGIQGGVDRAKLWTDAHESSEWNMSESDHRSSCMDWANNEIGRQIALDEAAAGHFVSTSAMQGDIIANDDVLISAPFKCW